MRIVVTGSREYTNQPELYSVLAGALRIAACRGERLVVAHGRNPRGADHLTHCWCRTAAELYLPVTEEPHPADWEAPCRSTCRPGHRRRMRGGGDYCPAAGNYRNDEMVQLGAERCLAFTVPGAANTGTADCVRRAIDAHIPVRVYGGVPLEQLIPRPREGR